MPDTDRPAASSGIDPAADHPTTESDRPNLSTEHQRDGDARRPSEHLDKGQPDGETIPRKSSLLGD